jgi:hypothetical protein
MIFWVRTEDEKLRGDTAIYFHSYSAAVKTNEGIEVENAPYLLEVEMSDENVSDLVNVCQTGDLYNDAYEEVKILSVIDLRKK